MEIRLLEDPAEKRAVTRLVLEDLPEWFGIPQAREAYIAESAAQPFFCAFLDGTPAGFCYLQETGKDTAEVAAMGVRRAFHRQGIGRALLQRAKAAARAKGYSFLQVKTVQMGRYAAYDRTNRFYLAMGFREFEVFPDLWDKWNPCQVYVMALRAPADEENGRME